ncbi:MAG: glycoside hydrolase family 31 protein, partial [Oscillospiraceae bacterium]|nr:glycoside hydrolase family 31 protein [Oscillospiraceae bacterium]
RFESNPDEKIYGLGQYQQPNLDCKGCEMELAHRNSQASVPFALSSLGYGFLWNNPSVGRVSFAKNVTAWVASSTKIMDYWITAGDSPADILENYGTVTGTVPMMPDWAMGFWQCKLRYQTQEELLNIAREYKRRGVPLSVIVVDFFHWTMQGDWKFDPEYWPDPQAMVDELKSMGVRLMVSVWPTVDHRSENFKEMEEKGYLISADRGVRIAMTFQGNTVHFDATNPGAREYVWNKAKKNYYDYGIKIFWLDEAEPEYSYYDFDLYRYHLGPNVQIGNLYPMLYARAFYDGMKAQGQENPINLLRCAWAGSQRYGALVWSGDIDSSFRSLRSQLAAGLNMGMAGIPWWTTDIGGFHGGTAASEEFRECFVRWFQYAAFCPVMRLHGDREPHTPPLSDKTTGGGCCPSGADNEIWSYGEDIYEICKNYIAIRGRMQPYIREQMKLAHTKGIPPMRTLFFDFPGDSAAWAVEDQFLFGSDLLVAPVLHFGMRGRSVYLPKGAWWKNAWTGEVFDGGQTVDANAPIDQIPLYTRNGTDLLIVNC